MKAKFLICGLFVMLAAGCAGNKEMLTTSINEAEGMHRAAQAEGIQKDLASAKQLSEEGKDNAALDAAEHSRLLYRLAFAEKDAKDAALADSTASKELQGDQESQKLYQTILDNETQDKEAAQ